MTEFKRCVDCDQRKTLEDFYVNRRSSDGRQRRCKPCQKSFMAAWYRENDARVRQRTNQWKRENPIRRREYNASYRKTHPEKSASATLWHNAKRLNALPKWANREAIDSVYAKAAALTKDTGVVHQVDHIVPLRAPNVCGMHVEHNLQILPFSENRAKSNKIWPDMPGVANAQ